AFLLFSMGIIGTGLLAVPVLAGASAFALAETFRWRRGLDLTPLRGARFYGVIAVSTLIGVGLGFTRIDPIKALYWAAVINGVISVPIMFTMMRMVDNPEIMGNFVATKRLTVLGWLANDRGHGDRRRSDVSSDAALKHAASARRLGRTRAECAVRVHCSSYASSAARAFRPQRRRARQPSPHIACGRPPR